LVGASWTQRSSSSDSNHATMLAGGRMPDAWG
jgi:hypothetical protein